MFSTRISSTPLTNDMANAFFAGKIDGESWCNDISFLASMRALLHGRIGEGENIFLQFGSSRYGTGEISGLSVKHVISSITAWMDLDDCGPGKMFIHSFNSLDEEANVTSMRAVELGFTELYTNFKSIEKVKQMYAQSNISTLCFVDSERKISILFVSNLTLRKLHYLQTGILAYLPWYFVPRMKEGMTPKEGMAASGCSELELDLIKSMQERTPDKWQGYIEQFAVQIDFRAAYIRQQLNGFESRYDRRRIRALERETQEFDRHIDALENEIVIYLQRKNEHNITIMGLQQRIGSYSDEDSELMEYFICHKNLHLESVSDSRIEFTVEDTLEFFDPEIAESTIDNNRSFVYRRNGVDRDKSSVEKMVKVLRAVFIDCTLKMRFCARYALNLESGVSVRRDYDYDADLLSRSTPNPHIDHYECLGEYKREINKLIGKMDYVGAIEQCIASCKSLNWGDGAVMNQLMRTLYEDDARSQCIQLPDGKIVKPFEAYEWLVEQDV